MLDVAGLTLSANEKQQLANPLVGGLILFSRNFDSIEQLSTLIKQIRTAASHSLIIAVDHEGGRVQRFINGFSHLPAMGKILPYCKGDLTLAKRHCLDLGWLMASELLALDIDISFAPVLDLDICSTVIGDRAFSDDPVIVSALGGAFISGMGEAGMACTGKHFPGHGSVAADSHIDIPIDHREANAIASIDQWVFDSLIGQDKIEALMPAHVIYPAFCDKPAGFSRFWLQTVLREKLGYDGVLFSDDLGMEGASVAGDFPQRTLAALSAGCDMVLVCNNQSGAQQVLDYLQRDYLNIMSEEQITKSTQRLETMLAKAQPPKNLRASSRWIAANALAQAISAT